MRTVVRERFVGACFVGSISSAGTWLVTKYPSRSLQTAASRQTKPRGVRTTDEHNQVFARPGKTPRQPDNEDPVSVPVPRCTCILGLVHRSLAVLSVSRPARLSQVHPSVHPSLVLSFRLFRLIHDLQLFIESTRPAPRKDRRSAKYRNLTGSSTNILHAQRLQSAASLLQNNRL